MEGETLVRRKLDGFACELLGGLRRQLIKGSYLAHAKKKNNPCSTLKGRNAIQEENKVVKTKGMIILAHILSYRSLESKLFVTLDANDPRGHSSHYRFYFTF